MKLTLDYVYEHDHRSKDNHKFGTNILLTIDISGALDNSFVVYVNHHLCHFLRTDMGFVGFETVVFSLTPSCLDMHIGMVR